MGFAYMVTKRFGGGNSRGRLVPFAIPLTGVAGLADAGDIWHDWTPYSAGPGKLTLIDTEAYELFGEAAVEGSITLVEEFVSVSESSTASATHEGSATGCMPAAPPGRARPALPRVMARANMGATSCTAARRWRFARCSPTARITSSSLPTPTCEAAVTCRHARLPMLPWSRPWRAPRRAAWLAARRAIPRTRSSAITRRPSARGAQRPDGAAPPGPRTAIAPRRAPVGRARPSAGLQTAEAPKKIVQAVSISRSSGVV